MMGALKSALPHIISSSSMCLGLSSIVLCGYKEIEWSAWFIIFAMILDKMDGIVARFLEVSSQFGMEMDSFSDFTVFGVAPAVLAWFFIQPLSSGSLIFVIWVGICASLYTLCAAIRLARFNLVTHADPDFFSGVPTTFAGGLFSATVLFFNAQEMRLIASSILPPILIVLAVFMISNIRVPKIKKRKSTWFNAFQVVVGAIVIGLTAFRVYPEILLFIGICYLLVGVCITRQRGTSGNG